MKSWQDIGFEIEITKDQSPTLRLLESTDPEKYRGGESMHHSGGACTETNLIYGRPIKNILEKITKPSFMVVGLGLGCIELTLAREALLLGLSGADIGMLISYESVPGLREFFHRWIHGLELHPEVQETYDDVAAHILKTGPGLNISDLKNFLKIHFANLENIRGAMESDVIFEHRYHGILYDAFSSKTTPHLWEEEFLKRMLREASCEESMFSTYACRGSVKRALRENGFEMTIRDGFCGKKNSTLGLRNIKS